jgi:hypothetical protein
MTQEQIQGVIRHVLTAVGGVLIAKGLLTDEVWAELSGAALTLIGTIWSVIAKKK